MTALPPKPTERGVVRREIVGEALASARDLTTKFVEFHECHRDRAIKQRLLAALVEAGLPQAAPVHAAS
jgi:hypothetical protein